MIEIDIKNIRKCKHSKLFKKSLALTLALTAIGSLWGCKKNNYTTLYKKVDFSKIDLLKNDDYHIINTKNVANEYNYYLVYKTNLYNIGYSCSDCKKYYQFKKEDYNDSDTYIYLDLKEGQIVSVQYDKMEERVFNTKEYKSSVYSINEIISDKFAYDYANYYYGSKDTYTKKELIDIIDNLNVKKDLKNKVKQKDIK